MSEKPILFSAPMIRAILNGTKTMTRRIVKPQPVDAVKSPYATGMTLWVRETWRHAMHADYTDCICYRADNVCRCGFKYAEDKRTPAKWKPSLFMRREYSRILLYITDVRMELLQDITEEEAIAEGMADDGRHGFEKLWDGLNDKRGYGWDVNPWVWVVSFKQLK